MNSQFAVQPEIVENGINYFFIFIITLAIVLFYLYTVFSIVTLKSKIEDLKDDLRITRESISRRGKPLEPLPRRIRSF